MLKYGQIISKERKKIRDRALKLDMDHNLDQEPALNDISKLAIKADKGYFCRRALKGPDQTFDFEE